MNVLFLKISNYNYILHDSRKSKLVTNFREELQQLCSGLFEKIQETLAEVLGKAQLTVEDIHSVEIIGGSCRIPAVKEIITNTFKKTPSTMLNMDEAVARGCALQVGHNTLLK